MTNTGDDEPLDLCPSLQPPGTSPDKLRRERDELSERIAMLDCRLFDLRADVGRLEADMCRVREAPDWTAFDRFLGQLRTFAATVDNIREQAGGTPKTPRPAAEPRPGVCPYEGCVCGAADPGAHAILLVEHLLLYPAQAHGLAREINDAALPLSKLLAGDKGVYRLLLLAHRLTLVGTGIHPERVRQTRTKMP